MRASSILIIGLLLGLASISQACLQIPESIDLDGASFSGALKMSMRTNCNLSLSLKHATGDFTISGGRQDEKVCMNFEASGKYESVCDSLMSKEFSTVKNTARDLQQIKDNSGKIVGLVEFEPGDTPTTIMIWSVDANGKVDRNKPYIRIDAEKAKEWKIYANDNGSVIGSINAIGAGCTRSIGSTAKGIVQLRDKHYITNGAGCAGKLQEVEANPTNNGFNRKGLSVAPDGAR